jgi:hypothetical protein
MMIEVEDKSLQKCGIRCELFGDFRCCCKCNNEDCTIICTDFECKHFDIGNGDNNVTE